MRAKMSYFWMPGQMNSKRGFLKIINTEYKKDRKSVIQLKYNINTCHI